MWTEDIFWSFLDTDAFALLCELGYLVLAFRFIFFFSFFFSSPSLSSIFFPLDVTVSSFRPTHSGFSFVSVPRRL